MMHVLILLIVAYLFGATLFMLWEANPVIMSISAAIALIYTIVEDLGK